jgi:ribose transport system substrate-binding protein
MKFVCMRFVFLFISATAFSISGCDEDNSETVPKVEALKFMWIPKELGNEVFETGRDGAFAKADELSATGLYDVQVTYAGPASALDIEGQSSYIEDAIDYDLDGIAISCNTTAGLEDTINEAVAAGIPVMTFDSDSPGSNRFSYLGIDNEHGGALAAEILGRSMTDTSRSKVAVLSGAEGAANLDARVKGFQDAMASDFPALELLDPVYCDDDAETAAILIEGIMTDTPDIGGFFFVGLWPLFVCNGTDCSESMPLWDQAAKSGQLKTVSFDTLQFELPFVQSGMIEGLIGQKYWGWGYDAVQMLFDYVINDKTYRDWTDSGLDIVCPNNVDEMAAMWDDADFSASLSPCELNGVTIEK